MDDQNKEKADRQATGYKDRFWIPRFWTGMSFFGWWGLLWRNRAAIHPTCFGMATILSIASVVNAGLWALQSLVLGRRIRRTRIEQDPIFVLGHWRSGTTLLHELLILDPRHTYPSTYACFAPNHFLISDWFFRPTLGLLVPSRRPMDNMVAGWDRPQEDEFALCNMGLPSPYLTLTFPNRPLQNEEYLDLEGVPPEQLQRWKRGLEWFLKCLTVRSPRRIVLKSPLHTCRIKTLLELFPRAKFVHIVRDPFVLFPSTVNLWKRLSTDEGLQVPRFEGLEEVVFKGLARMYDAFRRDRELIRPGNLCEVRYEDLVKDPVGSMRRIYEELDLGGFDALLPALETFAAGHKDYRTNRYQISPDTRAGIARRWHWYIDAYGYAPEPAEADSAAAGQ